MRINQLIHACQKAANPVEKQWPNRHRPCDRSLIYQTSQMQVGEQQLSGQFNAQTDQMLICHQHLITELGSIFQTLK